MATFSPKRKDTLKEHLFQYIGWRGKWIAGWILEDGIYEGQFAMMTHQSHAPPFGWVPQEDLELVL